MSSDEQAAIDAAKIAEREAGLREGDQQLPVHNDEVSCQQRYIDRVTGEMPARMELGLRRYKTLLQPFNGRNFMRDAFDELIDLSVYLEGVAAEREAMIELIGDVARGETGFGIQKRAGELLTSMGVPGYRRFGHDREGSQCYYELCGGTRLDPCGYTPEEIARFEVELAAEEALPLGAPLDDVDLDLGDRGRYSVEIEHVPYENLTAEQVRALGVDLDVAKVTRCPVHGMTDCSPMLNGCNRVTAS